MQPFGLIPMAAGNTGVQMGGWFNKEINTLADLQGLKMRIPGLGGEVLKRVGGLPVAMPGSEVFTSLQTGVIDATEWVGPYNDLAFGLHTVADYYYYPGWHEPSATIESIVNAQAWASLPRDLQVILETAVRYANDDMLAEFTAKQCPGARDADRRAWCGRAAFPAGGAGGAARGSLLPSLRRWAVTIRCTSGFSIHTPLLPNPFVATTRSPSGLI